MNEIFAFFRMPCFFLFAPNVGPVRRCLMSMIFICDNGYSRHVAQLYTFLLFFLNSSLLTRRKHSTGFLAVSSWGLDFFGDCVGRSKSHLERVFLYAMLTDLCVCVWFF
eukprot:GEMP01044030.1.p2 GENE.GEMP01044030.1~~GEMP01044030.1.p2  ORF type:complete len:109 (+),score=2.16 GEMP01044030.1:1443-1769(+)